MPGIWPEWIISGLGGILPESTTAMIVDFTPSPRNDILPLSSTLLQAAHLDIMGGLNSIKRYTGVHACVKRCRKHHRDMHLLVYSCRFCFSAYHMESIFISCFWNAMSCYRHSIPLSCFSIFFILYYILRLTQTFPTHSHCEHRLFLGFDWIHFSLSCCDNLWCFFGIVFDAENQSIVM